MGSNGEYPGKAYDVDASPRKLASILLRARVRDAGQAQADIAEHQRQVEAARLRRVRARRRGTEGGR